MYDSLTAQRDLAAVTIGHSVNLYDMVTSAYSEMFRYDNLHPAFINNLKDAIVHFQRLDSEYLSIDKDSTDIGDANLAVFIQFELLSEHITRGIIDVYVEALQHASEFYETFLQCLLWEVKRGTLKSADAFIKQIRTSMHFSKNSILELRTSKIDLIRIAKNQPVGLDGAFIIRLNIIRTLVRKHYEDMQGHLHNPQIQSIYDIVMNACEYGYSLYRVKDGDTLQSVADKVKSTTTQIRGLNNLKILDSACFPKEVNWIFY
jgi:hypothetical protein